MNRHFVFPRVNTSSAVENSASPIWIEQSKSTVKLDKSKLLNAVEAHSVEPFDTFTSSTAAAVGDMSARAKTKAMKLTLGVPSSNKSA